MARTYGLSPDYLRSLLPRVGDTVQARVETSNGIMNAQYREAVPLEPAVVEYVNREKLWCMVRFKSGLRECYTIPRPITLGVGTQ